MSICGQNTGYREYGKDPIAWRVLDKNDSGQYLIISEKTLDVQRYDGDGFAFWARSRIRSWLNGYSKSYNNDEMSFSKDNFINAAFTSEGKAKIESSNVPAHANPIINTTPDYETTDKIFLLSIIEAQQHFSNDTDRLVDATRYAVKKGATIYDSVTGNLNLRCTGICYSEWWLRSPGSGTGFAAFVKPDGSVSYSGTRKDGVYTSVRPALWLNLGN